MWAARRSPWPGSTSWRGRDGWCGVIARSCSRPSPAGGWTRTSSSSGSGVAGRHRRAGDPPRPARDARSCWSPSRCWTTARPAGRRAASPPRSARATRPSSTCRHADRRRRPLRPDGGAGPGHRWPGRGPAADRDRRRVRPRAGRTAGADQGRRPPAPPDRARGRRRDRRRDLPGPAGRAGRGGAPTAGLRGDRARAGARPAAHRRRPGRRDDPARARRGPAGRRRRGARRGGRAGHRRHRPGLRGDHQPARVHRRRPGAGPAGRRRGGRPGVRPVPPDGAVARPGRARPAAADLRGGARRGRVPGRRQPAAGS